MRRSRITLSLLVALLAVFAAVQVWGEGPMIQGGTPPVEPMPDTWDQFTFNALYTGDTAPEAVQVVVENDLAMPAPGSPFLMNEKDAFDVTYTDGKEYFTAVTLPAGHYQYTFRVLQGGTPVANYGPFSLTVAPPLPVLSNGRVTPMGGVGYEYRVKYQHQAGTAPISVSVIIDGNTYSPVALSRADANPYTTGTEYSTTVYSLSPGMHTYYFRADDGTGTVTLPAGEPPTPFSGPQVGVHVQGVVTRASDGAPVANATVRDNSWYYSATTDATGAFSLYLPEGTYTLVAQPTTGLNLVSQQTTISGVSGETRTADFSLPTGGTLTGNVTSADGPVLNATVSLNRLDGSLVASKPTGGMGDYGFIGLPTGRFLLAIQPPYGSTLLPYKAIVDVLAGDTREHDAVLAEGAVLQGLVKDTDGSPLAYTPVSLNGPTFRSRQTDEIGNIRFEGLPGGAYQVRVSPVGEGDQVWYVELTPGVVTTRDLQLKAVGGEITGRVLDHTANPIANAEVRVLDAQGYPADWAYSDPNGYFLADGLAAGTYRIEVTDPVTANGRLKAVRNGVTVPDGGSQDVGVITLPLGGILQGTVTDGLGPVAGAEVLVDQDGSGPSYSATTDALGNYTVAGLTTGNWRVEVTAPNPTRLGRFHEMVGVVAGQVKTLNVSLPAASSIALTVTDGTAPVAGATVTVTATAPKAPPTFVLSGGPSGPDGVISLGPLEAGTYALSVTPPGEGPLVSASLTGIVVGAGQTVPVSAVLKPAAALSGKVLDDTGIPVSGAEVRLGSRSLFTAADGAYAFTQVTPGQNTLTVTPPSDRQLLPMSVTLYLETGQSITRDVTLPKSSYIEAEVVDADGSPVGYAYASVVGQENGVVRDAAADFDGRIRVNGLPAGDYLLDVYPPGGLPLLPKMISSIHITPAAPFSQQVTLAGAGGLRGFVRNAGGDPVPNVTLQVSYALYYKPMTQTTVSASDGSYQFTQLPAGTVELSAQGDGTYVAATIPGIAITTGATAERDMVLAAAPLPGSARVTVTLEGSPVVAAQVYLNRADPGGSPGYVPPVTTDAAGVAVIPNLAPGTYRATVAPPYDLNALDGTQEGIVVTSGVETPVSVALPRGGTIEGTVTEAGGLPVRNTSVTALDAFGMTVSYGYTDQEGRYRLIRLQPGTYTLCVERPYMSESGALLAGTRRTGIVVSTGGTATVDVTLTTGATLRGTVTDSLGRRVSRAEVCLQGPASPYAESDDEGVFLLTGLTPGAYEVYTSASEDVNLLDSPRRVVVLSDGGDVSCDLVMPVGAILEGQVKDEEGQPIVGARVTVRPGSGVEHFTDAQGRFRFERLPAGVAGLTVEAPDRLNLATVRVDDIPVTAGAVAMRDITLTTGATLRGTVTYRGQAMPGALLSLWRGNDAGDPVGSVTADALGQFTFSRLRPGAYLLQVAPPSGRGLNAAGRRVGVVLNAAQDLQRDIVLPEGGILEGAIRIEGDSRPVADAFVSLYDAQGDFVGIDTPDSDGHYRFGNLESGSYRLVVDVEDSVLRNLLSRTYVGIAVSAGATTTWDVSLPAGVTFQGRVLHAGVGVPGAVVRLILQGHPLGSLSTEADGSFRFAGIPAGTYDVEVHAPGDVSLATARINNLQIGPDGLTRDITMEGEAVISCFVIDRMGVAVAGARAELSSTTLGVNSLDATGRTDSEGFLRIGRLPAGVYALQVYPPDNRTAQGLLPRRVAGIRVVAGQSQFLGEFILGLGGDVAGRVEDGVGSGLADIPIQVSNGTFKKDALTDRDGYYRIECLAPGTYRVEAMPGPYAGWLGRSMAGVQVLAGDETSVNMTLEPSLTLTGVVSRAGSQPVPLAGVALRNAKGEIVAEDSTGPDGAFTLRGLRPGLYTAFVYAPMGSTLLDKTVSGVQLSATGSNTLDVELASGGMVSGTVRRPDGTPAFMPRLMLRSASTQLMVQAGADGAFEFQGVRPGRYTLAAIAVGAPRVAPAIATNVVVVAGENVTRNLDLVSGGTLAVVVKDSEGMPVPDAWVTIEVEQPAFFADQEATGITNANGRVVFDGLPTDYEEPTGLPTGVYTIRVGGSSDSPGLLSQKAFGVAVVAGEQTEQEIILPGGTTVSGRAVDAGGAGVPDVRVSLRSATEPSSSEELETQTDSDGYYRIEGVRPGRYVVTANPGRGLLPVTIPSLVVLAGTPAQQNITLARGATLSGTITEGATGTPVVDGSVSVWPDVPNGAASARSCPTDARGNYLITTLASGRYVVEMSAPAHQNLAPTRRTITLTAGEDATLSDALTVGAAIEGTVRDETGTPIQGVSISLGNSHGAFTETDSAGTYRLAQLPAGTYNLSAQPSSLSPFGAQVLRAINVAAGQTVTRNLVLRQTGEIEGYVLTPEGHRVPGATVSVVGLDMEIAGLVDSYGAYHITGVPAGAHRLQVTPPPGTNLLPAEREGVEVKAHQTAEVDFTLSASGMLTGTVRDYAGKGVEGATVRVERSERGAPAVNAVTDSDGKYLVMGLKADRFDVTVAPPADQGHLLLPVTKHNVSLADGQTLTLDFTLSGGGTVSGTVLDSANGPVVGSVRIEGVGPDAQGAPVAGGFSRTVAIGTDGSYLISGVPAGTFTVKPVPARWMPTQVKRVTLAAGGAAMVDFRMTEGGSITGRVLGPGGVAVPGAEMTVLRDGRDVARVQTSESGLYQAQGLAPGAGYVVRARPDSSHGLLGMELPATVTEGMETTLNFQLSAGAAIAGVVKDGAGNPLAGVQVSVCGLERYGSETDALGQYRIGGLPEGTYDLLVAPTVGVLAAGQVKTGVAVTAGNVTTCNIQLAPTATITGTVRDKDGNPVPNVMVGAYGAGIAKPGSHGVGRSRVAQALGSPTVSAYSGSDGAFTIVGLPAGHFTVWASPEDSLGLAAGTKEVDVAAGQSLAINLRLPPAASIGGVVYGTGGQPLAGVAVRLTGKNWYNENTTTDAAGTYRFTHLAPGTYQLDTQAEYGEGWGAQRVTVEVSEGLAVSRDIHAEATGTVSGTVKGPDGLPRAGARVTLSGTSGVVSDSRTTGPDGTFTFTHVVAGSYKVVVTPPARTSLNGASADVVVLAGQTATREYLLPAATGTITGTISYTGPAAGPVLIGLFEAKPTAGASYGSSDQSVSRAARTRGWAAVDGTAVGTAGPLFQVSVPLVGNYTFTNVPDGQYHVLAVMDTNGNGQVDPGEPVGKYGRPNAVFVASGQTVPGINFPLRVPSAAVYVDAPVVTPRSATVGGTVRFTLKVEGAETVHAEIRNADTLASLGRVQLLDDGAHGDGLPGDTEYGGSFVVPAGALGDFYVDFIAGDDAGNETILAATAGFHTTVFTKAGSVLLLSHCADVMTIQRDSQGNTGAPADGWGIANLNGGASLELYYKEMLQSDSRTFDVWRTVCRGPLDSATLGAYVGPGKAVILLAPYMPVIGEMQADPAALAGFLRAGGRLLISSQAFGTALEAENSTHFDTIYREYLHAGLVQPRGSFELEGRSGDPVSGDLRFRISGGEGANNQSLPDAIVPLAPAQPILYYGQSTAALTRSAGRGTGRVRVQYPSVTARRGRAYSDPGEGPLCGGLRVDTGSYKVVYFAFGLEAIADSTQRIALFKRSMEFLTSPTSAAAAIQATASPNRLPADGASESTVTATVTDGTGAPVPDGTLVSFRAYNGTAPAAATTVGGVATARVRAGNATGPITLAITSGAAMANVVLEGDSPSLGLVSARSVDRTTVEAVFDRPLQPTGATTTANYTLTPTLAVTAAVLSPDRTKVLLTTGEQQALTYTLSVANLVGADALPLGSRNTATFQGAGAAPTVSAVAIPTRILANGTESSVIEATVTGADGQPVPDGTMVSFSAASGTLSTTSAPTVGGKASTSLTATAAGNIQVVANVGEAQATVTVEVVPPGPAHLTLELSAPVLLANGAETGTVTARVKDALDRPLDGVTVTFSTSLGTVAPTTVETVDGAATARLGSSTTGRATITAEAGALSQTVEGEFTTGGVQVSLAPPAGATLPTGTVVELLDASDAVVGTAAGDGQFRVSAVAGTYDVVVRAPGYVPLRRPGVVVAASAEAPLTEVSMPLVPQPNFGNGTRMVTLPFTFRRAGLETVLGDQDVVSFVYDPVAQRYRVAGESGFPGAAPGQGFWLKQRRAERGAPYRIEEPAELPDSTTPAIVPLTRGWQLIGSPFYGGTIDLSQVKVLLPGSSTPLALGDPAVGGAVRSYLWGWNGSSYELVTDGIAGAGTTLQPYAGYWVKATVDGVRLSIEPPTRARASAGRAARRSRATRDGWQARLVVRTGDGADTDNFFGVGRSALAIETPPAFEAQTDLRFLQPDGSRMAVDIQAGGNVRHVWRCEVAAGKDQEVVLTWPEIGSLPRNVRLVLVDEETGQRRYMRSTADYSYRSNGEPRRFRVEAEEGDAPLVTVTDIQVVRTRGAGRSISYRLNTGASATVRILSPNGTVLRQVATRQAAVSGQNTVYWNGADDRGVTLTGRMVLLEITAALEEGPTARVVHPMVIPR